MNCGDGLIVLGYHHRGLGVDDYHLYMHDASLLPILHVEYTRGVTVDQMGNNC